MIRRFPALLVAAAGCGVLYDHDNDAVRPPTDAELRVEGDLLAASTAGLAAATDEVVRQALAQPGQGVSLPFNRSTACPGSGKLHGTGTVSALCPQPPGRCSVKSFTTVSSGPPATQPSDCMYAQGLRLNAVLNLTLIGDDLASTISLDGVISVDAVPPSSPSGHVYGCVAKLSGAVPERTITGTYCYLPLTRSF
ncbi:MAG TPA: hypothetical protein VFL36_04885 [Myxococcales bacterium]|nr:hypothetical protein [Myxococcales bacterium]